MSRPLFQGVNAREDLPPIGPDAALAVDAKENQHHELTPPQIFSMLAGVSHPSRSTSDISGVQRSPPPPPICYYSITHLLGYRPIVLHR